MSPTGSVRQGRAARRVPGHLALALLLLLTSSSALEGQSGAVLHSSPAGSPWPAWSTDWTPLAPLADVRRELPGHEALSASLLTFPAPRIGGFWTAGNPAGAVGELPPQQVRFRGGLAGSDGNYHRPLDPGRETRGQLSGFGWDEFEGGRAVVGRAVFDRSTYRDGVFSLVREPHRSNPQIALDTVGADVNQTAGRLEAATGWRFGRLDAGLAVGVEVQETRTIRSPVPLANRSAAPGVAAGVNYSLGETLRLGLHGRWQGNTETVRLTTVAQPARVFLLQGFRDPAALDLDPARFFRRFDRQAWAMGADLSGGTGGTSWVVYGRREKRREGQFLRRENDPPTDTWEADGWRVGGALQRRLAGDRVLLTLRGTYFTLGGDAFNAEFDRTTTVVDEERLAGHLDLRYRASTRWELALRGRVLREERRREDLLERTFSDIETLHPAVMLEAAGRVNRRLAVSFGAGFSAASPSGRIPDPDRRGPVYRRFVAPELSLELTGTNAAPTGTFGLRWDASSETAVWVDGEVGSVSANPRPGNPLPFFDALTTSSRSGWRVSVGALLGG